MNWYHLYKLAQLSGEWWIDESGNATFADGDVGDMNHEAVVIHQIQAKYAEDFDRGEYIDWEGFIKHISGEKMQEAYADPAVMQEVLGIMGLSTAEQMSTIDLHDLAYHLMLQNGMSEEEWQLANGGGDARLFAAKNWGWKRLDGTRVETWTLTPQDLKAIANGLWDAYQDDAEAGTYSIFVASSQKWYTDIPYAVIADGKPLALREYDNAVMARMPRR